MFLKFEEVSMPTTGVDICSKKVDLPRVGEIKANIWDTAGQERYKSTTELYFKDCHGAMIVFNITNEKSFDIALDRYKEIKELRGRPFPVILVGA